MDPKITTKFLLIIGGSGILGKSVIQKLRDSNSSSWKVCCIDYTINDDADHTIIIKNEKFTQTIVKQVSEQLETFNAKYDGILTLSGNWIGGSIKSDEIFEQSEKMFLQNYYTALVDK